MRVHFACLLSLVLLSLTPPAGLAEARTPLSASQAQQPDAGRAALDTAEPAADAFEADRRLLLEGTPAEASRALGRFVAAGEAGIAEAAQAIASLEDAELAGRRQTSLRGRVQRQLGTFLAADDLESAQAWLEALAAGDDSAARRELVTFLALTGRREAASPDPLLKAWRLRADGDPLAARRLVDAQEGAGEELDELRIALAFDLEDWSALGATAWERAARGGERQLADLGLAAAAFRAADDHARADDCAARLSDLLGKQTARPAEAAIALLLNDDDDEAMPLLMAADEPSTVFNLLSAEWRHREALELAAEAGARGDLPAKERVKLEARVARLLSALSDSEGAARAVEAHATWSAKDRAPALAAAATTIGLELRVGLEDAARARAAAALDSLAEDELPRAILGALFPQTRTEAEVVWAHVGERHPEETTAQRLARCAAFLTTGSADAGELATLQASERERAVELDRADRARWYRGLAGLAERHGNEALALELAEEWNAAEERYGARNELAERQAEAGDWDLAAETWLEAYRENPGEPGPLALAGWALTEAGWVDAGEEMKRQASLVALGDGGRRYRLAGLLENYGLFEDAGRERTLLLRTQNPSTWAYGATLRLLAGHASCAGATADSAHWATPTHLQTYLKRDGNTPGLAHHSARKALDARVVQAAEQGDALAAAALAAESLGPWLRNLDLTAEALARLDDEGFVGEADRLSWRLLDRMREVSNDFPKSAPHAHAHAELAARTGRDLDAAVVTAERAVELRPKTCAYRSTLAEVLFVRGETDAALEALAPALEHCSKSEKYQQQALRFGGTGSAQTTEVAAD